jgi:23S rRNA pseudouridine1911/1915/1917 synthase
MSQLISEPEQRDYEVPEALAGLRLDQALAQLDADLSRSAAQRLIAQQLCLLNGTAAKRSASVAAGDRISVTVLPPEPTEVTPEAIPLNVVYEDADLIVIDKPSGMVVHPGAGNPRGTLVNALLAHCDDLSGIGGELRPGIVHRLDKETSGLLVSAKSDVAHRELSRQIAARTARRTYWALVWGRFAEPSGEVSAPIARHPLHRRMMGVVEGGRAALTLYQVLEEFRFGSQPARRGYAISLLELELKTGRTHQIRVHMTHIGHPILADPLYGRQRRLPQSASRELAEAIADLEGQALHARRLSFVHPCSGEGMVFEAEPPRDFKRVLEVLRKEAEAVTP